MNDNAHCFSPEIFGPGQRRFGGSPKPVYLCLA
jgi:hypothetical protein